MLNWLKRILFVAIIGLGLCGGNANGMAAPVTIFDLPANTPGLQNQDQNKSVNGIATLCKHIIVPRTAAHTAITTTSRPVIRGHKRSRAGIPIKQRVAVAARSDGNMYFPINGHQPTTAEAGQYSCARVTAADSNEVTDWYVEVIELYGFPTEQRE